MMKKTPWRVWTKRIAVIGVVSLLTLGAMLVADETWARHSMEQPLLRSVSNLQGVEDAQLKRVGTKTYLEIRVEEIRDFRTFYEDVEKAIVEEYGDTRVTISIIDNRDSTLEEAYYRAHFFIAEAIATGKFASIPSNMARVGKDMGLEDWQVWVGSKRVYLKMSSGGHRLYEVFDRNIAGSTRPNGAMGSDAG